MAHTPGPWEARRVGTTTHIVADRRDLALAADVMDGQLIAAAPELLDALQDMLAGWHYIRRHYGDLSGVGWDRCEQSSAVAIAKATGKAP